MGAERVAGHQLACDLIGKIWLEATAHVDRRQLSLFAGPIGGQFAAFARQVCILDIGLGVDRHILARRHRHCPGSQSGYAGEQDAAAVAVRGCDAQQQAGGGQDAVIGPQDGST